MPSFTFNCVSKRHEDEETRQFVQVIHLVKEKRVDQIQCPECGGLAKRDLVADLKTINTVGSTPISHASSVPGTLSHAAKFAFGQFKQNPDGSVDRNHTRFSTSGELERYVNGANDLGPPKIGPNGQPMRRPDGSMIRTGAKLVKYDRHRRPPTNKKPRVNVPPAWVGGNDVDEAGSMRPIRISAPHYTSPERGKR